jgi:hypothetical protein
MKRQTDNEQLLTDVLSEQSGADFGATLLDETLRHVRRKRQWRRGQRIGGVLALLAIIGVMVWPKVPKHIARKEVPISPVTPYQLVLSQPLLPNQLVTTSPRAALQLINSAPTLEVVVTARGGYREVGDDELIALAAPHIVALVRRSPNEAELLFLPEPTEAAAPRN